MECDIDSVGFNMVLISSLLSSIHPHVYFNAIVERREKRLKLALPHRHYTNGIVLAAETGI